MKHCGDITKLSGYTLPPVDCITGGSPCQDLSVAGKRAGLEGERSGLFMEQVRIVKEMRERDRKSDGYFRFYPRPRFMVWENVPGAFSSNKGKDFQAVLTEIVRVVEPGADDVPMPENGRWPKSGCLYDDMGRWSIAWRVHDAQFWGVPQRRKRIALVADFGGLAAPEVCFERKGMQWYPSPGAEAREETAAQAGDGIGRSGGAIGFTNRGIDSGSVAETLRAEEHGHQPIITMNPRPQSMCTGEDVAATLGADDYKEPQMVYDARGNGDGKTVPTLTGDHQSRVTDYTAIACQEVTGPLMASGYQKNGTQEALNGMYVMQDPVVSAETFHCTTEVEKVQTLKARDYKDPQIIACTQGCQDGNGEVDSVVGTIEAVDYKGPNAQYVRKGMLQMTGATVRRLTPLECERLQGYPDGWTDIGDWTDSKGKVRNATDSARYKALGNSIALPYWSYLLRRISAQYERPATLGSLFDGISGFPLIWAKCNGPKYCLWTSEIEEFPIAVCKKHFGDEETGEKGDLCDYLDKF